MPDIDQAFTTDNYVEHSLAPTPAGGISISGFEMEFIMAKSDLTFQPFVPVADALFS